MKKFSIIKTGIVFLLISSFVVPAIPKANDSDYTKNIYSSIAHHYLPALNVIEQETSANPKKKKQKKADTKIAPMSPGIQRKTALSILANYGDAKNLTPTEIFDESFWKDLELFCGPISRREAHTAASWNQTITAIGDIVSKRILTRLTTDTALLKKRQEAIRAFQTDKKLAETVEKILKDFAKQEKLFYSFWLDEKEANQKFIDKLYFPKWIKGENATLDTNAQALEVFTRGKQVVSTLQSLAIPISLCVAGSFGYFAATPNCTFLDAIYHGPSTAWNNLSIGLDGIGRLTPAARSVAYAYIALLVGGQAYSIYNLVSEEMTNSSISNYLQTRLIALSSSLRCVRKMYNLVAKNNALKDAIPSLKYVNKLAHTSEELSDFINIILTNTFTGNASFFSVRGRILAAYKLIEKVKNNLATSYEALGEVDAYLSMANLINKFSDKNTKFSYVDFVEGAQTPSFDLKGFWFPQLLFDSKVKNIALNNFEMGSPTEARSQNTLLTGPNMGGKSTILKAIVTCLLLAQSYGIAPANSMTFTPFSKIQTYINIPDNAAEGISLYKAQLLRVKHLLNIIRSTNGFTFTVFDEVFNGTSPEEAIVGSASVMENLAQLHNSVNIISTHYGLLTRVEDYTGGVFKNYKVTTIEKPDETFVFPYTIERGPSDQHIALKLVKKEGFLTEGGKFNLAERFAKDIKEGVVK